MSRFRGSVLGCAALGVFLCPAAWAQAPAKPDAPASAKPDVAAYVGKEAITVQELDAKILKSNMKLAQSLYDARRAAIDDLVMEKVLGPDAKAKGIAVEELIKQRVAELSKPVTDADVEAYFNANSARMGGKTLEQVSGQIRNYLVGQNESKARETLLGQLKEKAEVRVTLDAPRVQVPLAPNDPVKGPATAKVTIVEFSDFQ